MIDPTTESIPDPRQLQETLDAERTEDEKELIAALSGGRRWDRHQVAAEVKFWIAQAASSYVEVCRRVAWGHVQLSNLDWLRWVEAEVGLGRAAAYRCVTISQKLILPGRGAEKLLELGPVKAFDIVSNLDESEVELLANGGSVDDLTVDDIEQLSTRELRQRVRTYRKERDAVRENLAEQKKELAKVKDELAEHVLANRDAKKRVKYIQSVRALLDQELQRLWAAVAQTHRDAHPDVKAALAGAIESARVRLSEIQQSAGEIGIVAVETATPDGGFARLTDDAALLKDHLGLNFQPGEEVPLDHKLLAENWQPALLLTLLNELRALGFVEPGASAKTWVWKGDAAEGSADAPTEIGEAAPPVADLSSARKRKQKAE